MHTTIWFHQMQHNTCIVSWTSTFKWAMFQEILQNVAHLNILVHDVINLLYYEYWTDKKKYFYINATQFEN